VAGAKSDSKDTRLPGVAIGLIARHTVRPGGIKPDAERDNKENKQRQEAAFTRHCMLSPLSSILLLIENGIRAIPEHDHARPVNREGPVLVFFDEVEFGLAEGRSLVHPMGELRVE